MKSPYEKFLKKYKRSNLGLLKTYKRKDLRVFWFIVLFLLILLGINLK